MAAASRNILGHSPPTKEGPLFKYRNFWSGWAQRYFKLDKCYLHYLEAKHAPEPLESVPRGLIISAKPSDAYPDKQFVFEIQQKSGTVWYAQATSMEEMLEWIRVLSPVPTLLNPDLYPTYTAANDVVPHATAPSLQPYVPEATRPAGLYPNIPQDLYFEYHGNTQNPQRQSGGPPPPYSEIVHYNGK